MPRHGLQGDQAEEGGQEERQARGDIHGKLQLLLLQMVYKPKYLNLGEHGHWFIAFDATIANLLSNSIQQIKLIYSGLCFCLVRGTSVSGGCEL